MSDAATATIEAAVAEPASLTVGGIARTVWNWLQHNLRTAIITAVLGYVIGYIGNVWFMAIFYDGAQKVPAGGPASGEGNVLMGSLFWGLITTVLFAVFGYWRAAGTARFRQDLRQLPHALASIVTRDGKVGRIHLLWGAAVSLLATQLVSPAVGAVLAVGLLASLPGLIGRVLTSLVMRVWMQLLQIVAPTRKHRPAPMVSFAVGILGASAALVVGFFLPGDVGGAPTRLVIAVGCGLLAVVLTRGGAAAGPVLPLLLLMAGAGLVLAEFVHPLLTSANDGGVAECGVSWTEWLSKCEGRANVLVHAIAGGIAAAMGAPVGNVLGMIAALGNPGDWLSDSGTGPSGGDGSGGGSGGQSDDGQPATGGDAGNQPPADGGRVLPPPPPVPQFPHVFVRGGSLVIECANGVILTAPLNPDGTVGQWSATNLHTQSGGAVENQVTGDDGTVTTYYSDGSVVARDPSGATTTWGTDGSVTVAGADGVVTTTHRDGSVDVRSPDGSIDTTMPDGTTVHTDPDGTTTTARPDGSVVTNYPDGSIDATQADGTRIHVATDGSITTDSPDGTQTTQWTDGTTVTTYPDGSTQTTWPDGSTQQVDADGTRTTTSPDGTQTVLEPDGTFTTINPDGSAVIQDPDGTRTVEGRDGTVSITEPDGTTTTTTPGGFMTITHADGSVEVFKPDGGAMGNPADALRSVGDSLGYAQEYPQGAAAATQLYNYWQQLNDKVNAQGGVWTPSDLAALTWLQSAQTDLSNTIDKGIAADAQAFANRGMEQLLAAENADPSTLHDIGNGVMVSTNQLLQGRIDQVQDYIRQHMTDLPPGEWQNVESILDQVNSSSPNPAALNRLQQLSHAIFFQNQTGSSDGSAIANLVDVHPPQPPSPPLTGDALTADLISKAQDFLTNHADEVPLAETQRLQALVDRTLNSHSTADLADLRTAAHALFNQVSGLNENAGAAAQMDAIDAESRRVMWDRLGTAATVTEVVAMAPVMIAGAAGMVSASAGLAVANALAPVALPGAFVQAGQLGLMALGTNAIKGGIGGYYEGTDPDPTRRILYGVASATLPVNTINAYNAVAAGQDVSTGQIMLSVVQDLGNVAMLHGAGTQMAEIVGGPGGLIARLTATPSAAASAMDAGAIADRAAGQVKVTELQQAMLEAHNDDAWQAARSRLDNLQAGLARDPYNPALPGRIADAQAALDALPVQQRLNGATTDLLGDYQGKNILKNADPTVQAAYNQNLQPLLSQVDQQFIDGMNAKGLLRGGQPFTQADIVDFRNASSITPGMDRDLGLNELYARQLQAQINQLPAGSPQAADLQAQLNDVLSKSVLTAPGLDANGNVVQQRITPAEWQTRAQQIYSQALENVTGQDAQTALHQITQSKNIEAYPDLNVLKNDPVNYPFDPAHADAIGGVTSIKAAQAQHDLSPWNAMQETARGTAKDISTKLQPLLVSKGADPAAIAQTQEMYDFLKSYGNGNMLPSQADAYAQAHFGTSVQGLCDRVSTSMTTAIKWQPGMASPAGMSTASATTSFGATTSAIDQTQIPDQGTTP